MSDTNSAALKNLKELNSKIFSHFECSICRDFINTGNQFLFCPLLHKICKGCYTAYDNSLSQTSRVDNNKRQKCFFCKSKFSDELIAKSAPSEDYTELLTCLLEKKKLEKNWEAQIFQKIEKKFEKRLIDRETKINRLHNVIVKKNNIIRKLRPAKETQHEKLKRLIRKYKRHYKSRYQSTTSSSSFHSPATDTQTQSVSGKKKQHPPWPTVSSFFTVKRKKIGGSTVTTTTAQNPSPAIRPSNLEFVSSSSVSFSSASTTTAPLSPLSPNIFNPPSPPFAVPFPPFPSRSSASPPLPLSRRSRNKVLTPRRLYEIHYIDDEVEDNDVRVIGRQSETSATASIASASSDTVSGVNLTPGLRGNRFEDLVELTFGRREGTGGGAIGSICTSTVTSPSLRRPISSGATPPTAPGVSSTPLSTSVILDLGLTDASTFAADSGETVNVVSSVSDLPRVSLSFAESDPRRRR